MCRWEGGGGRGVGVFSQWGRWGKTSVQTSSNRFLKTLTEGAVTTEAGSLLQYFTTLTENADPLLRRWLAPWSTLKGCPLRPRWAGGRKNNFGSISLRPLNILKAVIREMNCIDKVWNCMLVIVSVCWFMQIKFCSTYTITRLLDQCLAIMPVKWMPLLI